MDDPDNLGVYDVNTAANYDMDIVPYLDSPVGSAFVRDQETGKFVLLPPDA
ncbi:MAG: immunity protein Imm33 domain-containing protein [Pyrinomonadaceae bacterium]